MKPASIADLRIERNADDNPVRVLIGPLDITALVKRIDSNTTFGRTVTEVVLFGRRSGLNPARFVCEDDQ